MTDVHTLPSFSTAEQARYRFTRDDLFKLYDTGVLADQVRASLWNGDIIVSPPPKPIHNHTVHSLAEVLRHALPDGWGVREEKPIDLGNPYFLPIPDIAIVKEKRYDEADPLPGDILLLVEVANTSLTDDVTSKLKAYASAGIGAYWVVDVHAKNILVFTEPQGIAYANKETSPYGSSLALPGLDCQLVFDDNT